MGHFIIQLSGGRQADVRFGKIRQKTFQLRHLFRRGLFFATEERTGYLVRLDGGGEFCLSRSDNGDWLSEQEGKFLARSLPYDQRVPAIQEAINEYERRRT